MTSAPPAASPAPSLPSGGAHPAPARLHLLLPCAGLGERAAAGGPKQYAPLAGRPLVAHTLDALGRVPGVDRLLLVLAPGDRRFAELLPGWAGPGRETAAVGGASRAETVRQGLQALRTAGAAEEDWVLVHDAARCLVEPAWVQRLIEACREDPVGGLLALPLADTLKAADPDGRVEQTLDRRGKWAAQTPQMFRLGLLARALDAAGPGVTDEASAIEALGLRPRLVPGHLLNLKVTWPEDFATAEALLRLRAAAR